MSDAIAAAQETLERVYRAALDQGRPPELGDLEPWCETILERQQTSRGVLAVLTTLLVKKACAPDQDVRLHQSGMLGGFSGRGLDERVVTPFLRRENFPYMKGGSGWLTRSFEQPHPYTLEYPGKISPAPVKEAFLGLIDAVERNAIEPERVLLRVFSGLIKHRDKVASLRLARPVNLTVDQIVRCVSAHYQQGSQGASKLPVISVHALMALVIPQMARYRGCQLAPLESHTAADARSGNVGDVSIVRDDGRIFEAFEIKLGQQISESIVRTAFAKFNTESIRRYYVLTTQDDPVGPGVSDVITEIRNSHGCQVIVNGVAPTIRYYLRLVSEPGRFVDQYVGEVESDPELSYAVKIAWNEVVERGRE